ncbi:MAG: IS21 family transposase [bacterium]
MYHEIHDRYRNGMKPSQIASFLRMDTRTVKKYLSMDEAAYTQFLEQNSHREKKLQGYEEFVRTRIENCLDASAAQVQDWLKEAYPDFIKVSERSVYNFVMSVRQKYGLAKVFSGRQFMMVEELAYGYQAQIDFGEYNMTDVDGHRKKVYFLALVLARSRFKCVYYSQTPFTTVTAITAMEDAFAAIGGYPAEVVFDQDKLFLYNENIGDLILTNEFRNYCQNKPFRLHFCRKKDPQSKGKIENVVKYIKYNFLRGRVFYDIHTLNAQSREWLIRTANAKIHATTWKVPADELIIEKEFLQPLINTNFMINSKVSYNVKKDNVISYKGSLYSLPIGTYQGEGSFVYVQEENNVVIISDQSSIEIVRHPVSLVKGAKVFNNNHARSTSQKIPLLIEQVASMFTDQQKATEFLEQIKKEKPRYVRDQVKAIEKACAKYEKESIDLALNYCCENKIYNASDFEPVILSLKKHCEDVIVIPDTGKKAIEKYQIIPFKSNISDYKHIL